MVDIGRSTQITMLTPGARQVTAKTTVRKAVFYKVGLLALVGTLLSGCGFVGEQENTAEFKGTRTESAQLMISCMKDKGWEPTIQQTEYDGPQIVMTGMTKENEQAYQDAFLRCEKKLPKHKYPETAEELRSSFDEFWLPKYQCLYAAGFLTNPAPTWEKYYEVYRAGNQVARPHYLVDTGQWSEAYRQCPVDVDNWE